MSPIRLVALLSSLSFVSPAAAMSLAPVDPELMPTTVPIRLAFALGDASDVHTPIYQLADEPLPSVRLAPREAELLGTSYEPELRGDVRTTSRRVISDFLPADDR